MPKRHKVAEQRVRLTPKATAYLNQEVGDAVSRQRAVAAASDRSAARLFVLSAALIAASALLGHLELGASNVGLLSWIAIAVTATAWVAGAIGERLRLARSAVPPVTTVTPDNRRRRHLAARDLAEVSAIRYENESLLEAKRRWSRAFTQLVALQTALVVAVELAAR